MFDGLSEQPVHATHTFTGVYASSKNKVITFLKTFQINESACMHACMYAC